MSCELKNNQICVDMGLAQVSEQSIIEENIKISKIQIGNKHLVIDLSDLGLGFETVDDYLERFKAESQEYNIEFIVYDSFKKSIDIRVHEIGAGFTDACGSGACASVVALMDRDLVSNGDKVKVNFVGGSLDIISTEEENRYRVHMIGPAEKVFSGYLEI